ncbi:hypothetical protein SKAU_G00426300 [Synaphobranchus kaupii]|uniref:Uncharacterized protein n=1 Tax=Synaphobranchus kaupii TaxID=118154 RepID=A0A9Q1E583_SYNKA|nr:hypothetical protein SKAU_G00426300 [Synaphobranchus kaupii]
MGTCKVPGELEHLSQLQSNRCLPDRYVNTARYPSLLNQGPGATVHYGSPRRPWVELQSSGQLPYLFQPSIHSALEPFGKLSSFYWI